MTTPEALPESGSVATPEPTSALIPTPIPAAHLREVLHLFRDGAIVDCQVDGVDLVLAVEHRVLAQQVELEHRIFSLRLVAVQGLAFTTWPRFPKTPVAVLTDPAEVFIPELQILGARSADNAADAGTVLVRCNQIAEDCPWYGGELRFSAAGVVVVDEGGGGHDLASLRRLAAG